MRRFLLILVLLGLPLPALATDLQFTVTVGGQTYRLTSHLTGNFDALNTTLGGALSDPAQTPWFGSSTTAATFATQLLAQQAPPTTRGYWFVYERLPFAGVDFHMLTSHVLEPSGSSGGFDPVAPINLPSDVSSTTFSHIPISYMSAVAVPEIDGPVLAQVGFVLGALTLGLRARRRHNLI